MVFFGVYINRNEKSEELIGEFNNNLHNKQVAFLMFTDDSNLSWINDVILAVYMKPLFNTEMLTYLSLILIGVGALLNLYVLWVLAGFILFLLLIWKYILFIMLGRGLRKKGYTEKIRMV